MNYVFVYTAAQTLIFSVFYIFGLKLLFFCFKSEEKDTEEGREEGFFDDCYGRQAADPLILETCTVFISVHTYHHDHNPSSHPYHGHDMTLPLQTKP